jgi:hypothetical protein
VVAADDRTDADGRHDCDVDRTAAALLVALGSTKNFDFLPSATVGWTNFFDRPSEEDGSISIRAVDEERGLRARGEERR